VRNPRRALRAYLALIALVIAGTCFIIAWQQAGRVPPPTWSATKSWIASAQCAKALGIPLIGCEGGKIVPFADISAADDPGHAFFLSLYAIVTRADVHATDVARMNTIVNYVGIAIVVCLLLQMRLWLAGMIAMALLAVYAAKFIGTAAHPAQIGGALLSATLPLVLLGMPALHQRRLVYATWLAIGSAALAAACLLRQSIGMMGVVAACLAVGVLAWRTRGRVLASGHLALAIGAVAISAMTPKIILRLRDAIWNVPATTQIETHGVWHNVFLGLGVVENPFGIRWDDLFAYDIARATHPTVRYVSEQYYEILRDKYFELVMSHPVEVLEIYLRKLAMALNARPPLPLPPVPLWVTLLLLLIGVVACRRMLSKPAWIVLAICAVFSGLFLVQGAIVHPAVEYLFPIGAFLILACACLVAALVEALVTSHNSSNVEGGAHSN